MKVVLTKNVDKLGIVGEEKEVKDGFARNWLIPNKLAVLASDKKAKSVIEKAKNEREKVVKELDELKTKAKELSGQVIEVTAKAGEKGKLFAAVTIEEIAKKLKTDAKEIEMKPIKELGEHEVILKLGHGLETKIKIKVTGKEGKTSKK